MRLPTLLESRKAVAFVVAVLVAVLVTSLVYTIFAIRATQVGNSEVLRLVKDCTQPTGQCFKRGQARTATAVEDINRVAVIAAACVDERGTQTVEQIRACVMDALTEEKP